MRLSVPGSAGRSRSVKQTTTANFEERHVVRADCLEPERVRVRDGSSPTRSIRQNEHKHFLYALGSGVWLSTPIQHERADFQSVW